MAEQEAPQANLQDQDDIFMLEDEEDDPNLFGLVIKHTLEWPSLTVQWLPPANSNITTDHNLDGRQILLGTHTSGNNSNYLIRACVYRHQQNIEADAIHGHSNGGPIVNVEDYKVRITQKINHAGKVNRARYMPQNPVIIATKTVSGQIHVFDYTMYPSTPPISQQSSPCLRLAGHSAEGKGLAWSTSKEGYLLSGSDDARICLWDTANANGSRRGILRPLQTFQAHSAGRIIRPVRDVAWHSDSDALFGSAGDDGQLLIWDHRALTGPTQTVKVNEEGINCLAFEPLNKELVAVGCAEERILVLYDLRQLSQPLHKFLTDESTGEVYHVEWDPNCATKLASAEEDAVKVWDLTRIDTQKPDRPHEPLVTYADHSFRIPDLAWNEMAEGMIASIDNENSLRIWQIGESFYNHS
ncbi:hypothetical protein GOP47_0024004 [Adiantum capillus-veneris]|uniref:Histone-binding protein RBBP4-like N-terminal domain-containing protein n=1 Tax=Adiantum capillus-veneris TaxID=13818 RepID=A0A9D4U6Q8_ADICA|nr:hypothetical protein GOP47_0024004 [Adiantum capillus-veneris]